MSVFLLDTDHLTLYEMGHPQLLQNVVRHLADELAISVITVEEQLSGWQLTRIEVVLYERDEVGEPPGVAIELYTPFDSFDPSARTRGKIGEWLVSEFPPRPWNIS